MDPSHSNSTLVARFFTVGTERAEGPFGLDELAGQLRKATLNADSLLCREGEEAWVPFRKLPEFAEIQKLAVAVKAAAPTQEKEKPAERPAPDKKQTWPLIITVGAVGVLAIAVLALASSHGKPAAPSVPPSATPSPPTPSPVPTQVAPAPAQTSWPTVQDERFTIQCPVSLEKADGPDPGAYHYSGKLPGTVFSVVCGTRHGHAINALRDKWLRTNHGKIVSDHHITFHGHDGREVTVTMPGGTDTTETGRVRFFVTDDNTFEVFVGAEPGKFSDEDMTKFLDSFEIR